MAFFSFYNMRKPRHFDHKPIYWDPHKEELEERIRRVKRESGQTSEDDVSGEDYKEDIKEGLLENMSHLKKSREKGHDSRSRASVNMKLLLAVALLAALYWLLYLR